MAESEPKPKLIELVGPGAGQGWKAVLRNGKPVANRSPLSYAKWIIPPSWSRQSPRMDARSGAEIETVFRKFYAGRPMVRIWPAGSLPELQHVAHTNFCDIGFSLDNSGKRLIIVSCLDNLGKGAAGQAVQNFNLMSGIEEQTAIQ